MDREPGAQQRAAGPHPIQVRLAFGGEGEQQPEFAVVASCEGSEVVLRMLGDSTLRRFTTTDPGRLQSVLARPDVCRWEGKGALALVNPRYRVLAIAVGPSELPRRLEVNYGVVRVEDGVAVEMPGDSPDQPSWYVFSAEEVVGPA